MFISFVAPSDDSRLWMIHELNRISGTDVKKLEVVCVVFTFVVFEAFLNNVYTTVKTLTDV